MTKIDYLSGHTILSVEDKPEFIEAFNEALNKMPNNTHMFNDCGEDWVETVDVEDKESRRIWVIIPQNAM